MTVQTLYTAATGMQALETKLDVIANNMANINTTASRRTARISRTCSIANTACPVPKTSTAIARRPASRSAWAFASAARRPNYEQGAFETTNNPLDLAIEGDGFFQIVRSERRLPLHAVRQLRHQRQRQLVLGSADNGYSRGLGHHDSARSHRHRHQHRRPGADPHAGLAHAAKRRPVAAGEVHQSRRPLEARRQPVQGDRRLEHRATRQPGPSKDSARFGRASWKPRTSSR